VAPPRRSRRGQAAVLVALVLFTLVLLLALSTNMGILIHDRIRVQSTADLATYAAAYREAQALNDLALANQAIAREVAECRAHLVESAWTECNCLPPDSLAEATIDRCVREIESRVRVFLAAASWDRSVAPALAAGRATAEADFPGAGSLLSFMEHLPGSPTREGTRRAVSSQGTVASIADFEQAVVVLNYMHVVECPVCDGACCAVGVAYPERRVPAWFWKRTDQPDVWVEGRVRGTPLAPFIDLEGPGGDFFGASSTGGSDTLWAYAVAKPFEGSVGPTQLSWADRNGEWTDGPLYVPGLAATPDPSLGMIPGYRARLAGIHERLAGPMSPAQLIDREGIWPSSAFRH
jgi:hypothetical protein